MGADDLCREPGSRHICVHHSLPVLILHLVNEAGLVVTGGDNELIDSAKGTKPGVADC